MRHIWTEEEKKMLREFIPGHHHKEIQAEVLRVFGWEPTQVQIAGFIKNHKIRTGFTGRYEKCHVSHNKGVKMLPEQYEKSKPTMFKPGQLPPNTDPVGTEKMLSDGYIWVKIDNQLRVKKHVNWRQKHRLVWEEAHGPIPKGKMIIFLDGDRTNCNLDNLEAVTKAENAMLNKFGYRSENGQLTRVALDTVKLLDKIRDRG